MKKMYVDIGELGWSFNLSAHLRWRKEYTDEYIGVMTYPDRHCLYNGIVDAVYKVPDDFYIKFNQEKEACFGLKGTSRQGLSNYFAKRILPEYELRGVFGYKIRWKETMFKPYLYSKELNGEKEILIFPRCRNGERFRRRNLPRDFYVKLIIILCDKFPDYIVRTMGISSGSYNIWNDEIKKSNYRAGVKENADLQELIDRCQIAMTAVGSQSAPPKLALLQSVPTFMIGHQKERHIRKENWMSTKVGFYEIPKNDFAMIDIEDCISKIIAFVKGCQNA